MREPEADAQPVAIFPGVSAWTLIGNVANVATYMAFFHANPQLASRLNPEVKLPNGGRADFVLDNSFAYELKPSSWQFDAGYSNALSQLDGYLQAGGYTAGLWSDLGINGGFVGVTGTFSGYGVTLSGQFIVGYDSQSSSSGLLFYGFYGSYKLTPGAKLGVSNLTFFP